MIDRKLRLLEKLPAFEGWYVADDSSTESIEERLTSYQRHYAKYDQMVLYLELFSPEFVEVNGLILHEGGIPENLEDIIARFKQEGRPLASIEYLYNHVHLDDFCLNDPDYNDIPQEIIISIAREVEKMWRWKLTNLFPDRKFVVGIGNEDAEVEVFAYVERD